MTIFPKFRASAVQTGAVFLDRERTVEKACALIREAAANGASLVVFPEVFIPGYPHWVWLEPPLKASPHFIRLYRNSVVVPSETTDRLCAAAREADACVVIGVNEIDAVRIGTIYSTNLFIDRTGVILGKHRKLVPTLAEKMIWGSGDGSTLRVYETSIGRLGGLNCGENTNTLARYALLAQGEQVHIANYPAFPYQGHSMAETIALRARAHAFEGKVFVVVACSVIDAAMRDLLGDTEEKREMLTGKGNALSAILGPDGSYVAGPLIDDEGIVYGDIDLQASLMPKLFHDITGHYNRFDVLRLQFNPGALVPLAVDEFRPAPPGPSSVADWAELLAAEIRPRLREMVRELIEERMPPGALKE
jgi:aliphatic nitrilase